MIDSKINQYTFLGNAFGVSRDAAEKVPTLPAQTRFGFSSRYESRIVGVVGVQGLKLCQSTEDINCRDTPNEVSTGLDLLAIQSYKADDNQIT